MDLNTFAAVFGTPGRAAGDPVWSTAKAFIQAAGAWDRLDALYLYAMGETDGLVNLISPGTNDTTLVGSPAFTEKIGWISSTGNYLNSNLICDQLTKYQQDDACIIFMTDTATGNTAQQFGAFDGTVRNYGRVRSATGAGRVYINSAGSGDWAETNGAGLWIFNRTASNATAFYREMVARDSDTDASNGRVGTYPMFLGTFNNLGSPSTINPARIMAFGAGASLDAAQRYGLQKGLVYWLGNQNNNIITNGTFDADTHWILGTGWTISGGTLNCNGSATVQVATYDDDDDGAADNILASQKTYLLSFDVVVNSGAFECYTGGGLIYWNETEHLISSSGHYDIPVRNYSGADEHFYFRNGSSFDGSIDNVTIKPIIAP